MYSNIPQISIPTRTQISSNFAVPNNAINSYPVTLPSQYVFPQQPVHPNPASYSLSQTNAIKYIFVSRLSLTTTERDVFDFFLSQLGVRCVSCHKINGRANGRPNFVSFKVGLMNGDFIRALQPNVWPTGLIVREFVDRRDNYPVLPGFSQLPSSHQPAHWQQFNQTHNLYSR
jgi:hypothetical protein